MFYISQFLVEFLQKQLKNLKDSLKKCLDSCIFFANHKWRVLWTALFKVKTTTVPLRVVAQSPRRTVNWQQQITFHWSTRLVPVFTIWCQKEKSVRASTFRPKPFKGRLTMQTKMFNTINNFKNGLEIRKVREALQIFEGKAQFDVAGVLALVFGFKTVVHVDFILHSSCAKSIFPIQEYTFDGYSYDSQIFVSWKFVNRGSPSRDCRYIRRICA